MRWENTVLIDAPVSVVWQLTIDIERWPSITPTMRRVERLDSGPLRVGSSARIKQPGLLPAVWTVTHCAPKREFIWQTTRMGLTMVGSHIVAAVGSQCRNTVALDVAGPAARLFGFAFGRVLGRALERENAGFKATAQRST
jgi:uncharacterized membrane protein